MGLQPTLGYEECELGPPDQPAPRPSPGAPKTASPSPRTPNLQARAPTTGGWGLAERRWVGWRLQIGRVSRGVDRSATL